MALTASIPTEADPSGNPIDDTRRIFGGMVATAADGTPRLGVIDPDPSTPIVTGTTSMAYVIKGDVLFVTQRDSSTGGRRAVSERRCCVRRDDNRTGRELPHRRDLDQVPVRRIRRLGPVRADVRGDAGHRRR